MKRRLSLRQAIQRFSLIEFASALLLSVLFSISIVLSNHICITGGTYAGTIEQNYITPYSMTDFATFVAVFAAFFIIVMLTYGSCRQLLARPARKQADIRPLKARPILFYAGCIALLHIPYLLAYWPGFIFGDSIDSINQALGNTGYSNHHPVAYTMIIQGCISFTHSLGFSTTTGCALYSLLQTVIMTLSYSILIQWIMQRSGIRKVWAIALVAVFGITPYIATYSIAMWKDPLFSAAIVVITVLLFDLVATKGAIAKTSKAWIPLFAFESIVIVFLRSNGIAIEAILLASLLACAILNRKRSDCKMPTVVWAIPAIAIAASLLITGPIYNALGISPNEKVEGLGIPLNQMARVVAYDGDMSESDKEYMSSLLPLEQYQEVYAPTCTDPLKWDAQFNPEPLTDGFWPHWLSMLVKNPLVYFEAWEMQTFGYWTVNHPSVVFHQGNISGGEPRTAEDPRGTTSLGIKPKNLFGNDLVYSILPYDNYSIPIGWLTWLLLFASMVFALAKKTRWILPLIPSLALILSLLIASPIWYWERYAAALQFLLPFYITMLFVIPKINGSTEQTAQK